MQRTDLKGGGHISEVLVIGFDSLLYSIDVGRNFLPSHTATLCMGLEAIQPAYTKMSANGSQKETLCKVGTCKVMNQQSP